MRCSGCGKNIPFGGEVCPYCQRDKGSDQTITVWGTTALLFGGFIGNAVSGFGGMVVGGLGLAIFVTIFASVRAAKKGHSAKKPPRVRVDTSRLDYTTPANVSPSSAQRDQVDPVARLKRLDHLKSEGILTEEEYQRQRAAIVGSL